MKRRESVKKPTATITDEHINKLQDLVRVALLERKDDLPREIVQLVLHKFGRTFADKLVEALVAVTKVVKDENLKNLAAWKSISVEGSWTMGYTVSADIYGDSVDFLNVNVRE